MTERFAPGEERFSSKVVIFDAGNAVLTVLRAAHDRARAGQWDLPGGEADPHEAAIDCARRETWEETGFDLPRRYFQLVWRDRRPSAKGPHVNTRSFFRVELGLFRPVPPRLDIAELATHEWRSPAEAATTLGHCVQREAIDRSVIGLLDSMRVDFGLA